MYVFIKKNLKKIIPRDFLFKNELFFRGFLIPFYTGKKYQCNICKKHWRKFIDLPGDLLCPYCGSRSRTRRLYRLLQEKNALQGKVLHFSPSRSLYRLLKKRTDFQYFSTDFEDEFLADYRLDIRDIDFPSGTFDTVVCYHVLEHIIEDEQAMREMFRVLKKDGQSFVQTPFKEGAIYEDYSITDEEEREKAFGQKDHVRVYSMEGLKKRLEKVGFTATILQFEEELKPYGMLEEKVFWLKKALKKQIK